MSTLAAVTRQNRAPSFWGSTIGKKIVMAVTGILMFAFVIGHLLGNLQVFEGPAKLNAYGAFLHSIGELLWPVRAILLIAIALHITATVQLALRNKRARPTGYSVKKAIASSYASRTMYWSGPIVLAFIIFHLLHLTIGAVGFEPGQFKDLAVFQNVLAAFAIWPIAVFYVVAMGALCLHLYHGIWSMLQTLGWSTARNQRQLKIVARVIAIAVFVGFSSVPVSVWAGWLR